MFYILFMAYFLKNEIIKCLLEKLINYIFRHIKFAVIKTKYTGL